MRNAIRMGGVLRYKWEAYCDTKGRSTESTEVVLFPESPAAPKALQYKLEAYCNINWRCIAILFWQVVVVGVPTFFWFRKRAEYCFESTVLEERTHENPPSSLPRTQWGQKNSLSSVLKTVLSETIFGPFPRLVWNRVWGRSRQQWREAPFHWMRARHSVNESSGKEFYRKGIQWRGRGHPMNCWTLDNEFSTLIHFLKDAAFLLTVGSFLLTVELFYLQLTILAFLLTVGAFCLQFSFLAYSWSFSAYKGKCV